MRAFFLERAHKYNSQTADPTFFISFVRTMVLAFAILAIVVSRSNLCDAAQTAPAKPESAQATTSLAVQGAAWSGNPRRTSHQNEIDGDKPCSRHISGCRRKMHAK